MAKTKKNNKNFIKIGFKIIILLFLSSLIHFLPNWFKFPGLEILAPNSESIFQHERILFGAYFFYSLAEYFYTREKIKNRTSFWMSRFLLLTLLPWVMIMIYLLPQSFTGKMPSEGWETFWAILSTFLVWVAIVLLENDLAISKYSKKSCVLVVIFFLFLVLSNIIFTYNLPVYDVFSVPKTLY